jgi:hypothetical protein
MELQVKISRDKKRTVISKECQGMLPVSKIPLIIKLGAGGPALAPLNAITWDLDRHISTMTYWDIRVRDRCLLQHFYVLYT